MRQQIRASPRTVVVSFIDVTMRPSLCCSLNWLTESHPVEATEAGDRIAAPSGQTEALAGYRLSHCHHCGVEPYGNVHRPGSRQQNNGRLTERRLEPDLPRTPIAGVSARLKPCFCDVPGIDGPFGRPCFRLGSEKPSSEKLDQLNAQLPAVMSML